MDTKPVPAQYILFEDKTYMETLKELINQDIEILDYKIDELEKMQASILDKMKQLLIELYKIYREDVEKNPLTYLEEKELSQKSFEELKETIKKINLDRSKIVVSNLEKINDIINELVVLNNRYSLISLALETLIEEKKRYLNKRRIYEKLYDLLRLYPKHLRLANLSEYELSAIRFVVDAYFSIFATGVVLDNPKDIAIANFVILPLILNIQETSLSREGFFLRLLHHAPLISAPGPSKEEIRKEVLKELYSQLAKETKDVEKVIKFP